MPAKLIFDAPDVSRVLFHPRSEPAGYLQLGIPTQTSVNGAKVAGYLHLHESSESLLLFFHGNGEIAADYDDLV